jgi:hypothetical protein
VTFFLTLDLEGIFVLKNPCKNATEYESSFDLKNNLMPYKTKSDIYLVVKSLNIKARSGSIAEGKLPSVDDTSPQSS